MCPFCFARAGACRLRFKYPENDRACTISSLCIHERDGYVCLSMQLARKAFTPSGQRSAVAPVAASSFFLGDTIKCKKSQRETRSDRPFGVNGLETLQMLYMPVYCVQRRA